MNPSTLQPSWRRACSVPDEEFVGDRAIAKQLRAMYFCYLFSYVQYVHKYDTYVLITVGTYTYLFLSTKRVIRWNEIGIFFTQKGIFPHRPNAKSVQNWAQMEYEHSNIVCLQCCVCAMF